MQNDYSSYNDLQFDSRKVKPGDAFFAIIGNAVNGEDYIEKAILAGAGAIIVEQESFDRLTASIKLPHEAQLIGVKNIRKELALAAAKRYLTSPPLSVAAVTGTNGKSSICSFYRQLVDKSAAIGTIGLEFSASLGDEKSLTKQLSPQLQDAISAGTTTLDPIALPLLLNELHSKLKVENIVLEASSHGLSQYRIDGLKVDIAAFTNITPDHMEYHSSFAEYYQAKSRLFSEVLDQNGTAILNADIPQFTDLKKICDQRKIRTISYGFSSNSDVKIRTAQHTHEGMELDIDFAFINSQHRKIPINIYGDFQVYNIACAAAMALARGNDADDIVDKMQSLHSPLGRMQLVAKTPSNAKIFVDYAHTPDALEKALQTLRLMPHSRIITIFGCGGERFQAKRGMMGEIAAKNSDITIVTDDNPRSEDPQKIRAEIIKTCPNALEIANRDSAIAEGIKLLSNNDILLVAGKGHEQYQIIGKNKIYQSDIATIRSLIPSN